MLTSRCFAGDLQLGLADADVTVSQKALALITDQELHKYVYECLMVVVYHCA